MEETFTLQKCKWRHFPEQKVCGCKETHQENIKGAGIFSQSTVLASCVRVQYLGSDVSPLPHPAWFCCTCSSWRVKNNAFFTQRPATNTKSLITSQESRASFAATSPDKSKHILHLFLIFLSFLRAALKLSFSFKDLQQTECDNNERRERRPAGKHQMKALQPQREEGRRLR